MHYDAKKAAYEKPCTPVKQTAIAESQSCCLDQLNYSQLDVIIRLLLHASESSEGQGSRKLQFQPEVITDCLSSSPTFLREPVHHGDCGLSSANACLETAC